MLSYCASLSVFVIGGSTRNAPAAHKSFDLETFTFNGKTLRTVVIYGKPWFVIKEIADILELERGFTRNVNRFLDDAERLLATRQIRRTGVRIEHLFPTGSQASFYALVSESGLYKCVLRAQRSNPAARDFQDWVTKEVLPRIRQNGAAQMFQPTSGTAPCPRPSPPCPRLSARRLTSGTTLRQAHLRV